MFGNSIRRSQLDPFSIAKRTAPQLSTLNPSYGRCAASSGAMYVSEKPNSPISPSAGTMCQPKSISEPHKKTIKLMMISWLMSG